METLVFGPIERTVTFFSTETGSPEGQMRRRGNGHFDITFDDARAPLKIHQDFTWLEVMEMVKTNNFKPGPEK